MLKENKHIETDLFAYFPMRLTGLGIAERTDENNKTSLYDRDKNLFLQDDFMRSYASIPITITHPEDNAGNKVPLGFKNSDLIVGNAIYSYFKENENEIWVIGKIFNKEAVNLLKEHDFSTSPHFISQNEEYTLENGDKVLKEIPIAINHLAIVANGFWDKKSKHNTPIIKETQMENEKVDNAEETPKVDSIVETETPKVDSEEAKVDNTETKEEDTPKVDTEETPKVDELPAETQKADDSDIVNKLVDKINELENRLANIETQSVSDEELNKKDEVIEAINDIADSSDLVEKVRNRESDTARMLLQRFLKANKKNISAKYHSFIDSIPDNALDIAKTDVLQDLKNNLMQKKNESCKEQNTRGWNKSNNGLATFKF